MYSGWLQNYCISLIVKARVGQLLGTEGLRVHNNNNTTSYGETISGFEYLTRCVEVCEQRIFRWRPIHSPTWWRGGDRDDLRLCHKVPIRYFWTARILCIQLWLLCTNHGYMNTNHDVNVLQRREITMVPFLHNYYYNIILNQKLSVLVII